MHESTLMYCVTSSSVPHLVQVGWYSIAILHFSPAPLIIMHTAGRGEVGKGGGVCQTIKNIVVSVRQLQYLFTLHLRHE